MTRFELPRSFAPLALMALGLLAAGEARAFDVCGDGVCNPNAFPPETSQTCPADCGSGPPPPPPPNPCSTDSCGDCARPSVGADKDFDSIPDRLEHDLAHKFFPRVLLQHAGVDRDESFLFEGFAIPYTLKPIQGSGASCDSLFECVEIRYGIAFFEDHGDIWGLYSHLGDGEMYAAVLRRTASWAAAQSSSSSWQMIRDFTSAHWMAGISDSSRTGAYGFCPTECSTMFLDKPACDAGEGCSFGGSCTGVHGGCLGKGYSECQATGGCNWNGGCLKSSSWTCYDTSPKTAHVDIFAAESKHALYHTDSECDGGGVWNSDDCPNNAFDMRSVKGGRLQNIGNSNNHGSFDVRIKHPDRCKLYDVWSNVDFGEDFPYRQYLTGSIDWLLD